MAYGVTSEIRFCYGHRLLGHPGKCKHPHGHNGLVVLTFRRESLDSMGMVIDFDKIDQLMTAWINKFIDHQMILRNDDPLVPMFKEMKEPVYLMDENPTAENLAKLVFDQARKSDLPVVQVDFYETPTQYATYTAPK